MRDLDDSTVDNEAYCRHLVATAGLPAAITTIEEFAGVRVLVAEPFHRVSVGKRVTRLQQEDGCQSTIVDPADKYQTDHSGPTLRNVARALAAHGGQLAPLLLLVTFTVAIGNADLHGKNVSLRFNDDDRVGLAPIYDAMSTRLYDTTSDGRPVDKTLGMRIAGPSHIDAVAVEHLIDEGQSWGSPNGSRSTQSTRQPKQSVPPSITTRRLSRASGLWSPTGSAGPPTTCRRCACVDGDSPSEHDDDSR